MIKTNVITKLSHDLLAYGFEKNHIYLAFIIFFSLIVIVIIIINLTGEDTFYAKGPPKYNRNILNDTSSKEEPYNFIRKLNELSQENDRRLNTCKDIRITYKRAGSRNKEMFQQQIVRNRPHSLINYLEIVKTWEYDMTRVLTTGENFAKQIKEKDHRDRISTGVYEDNYLDLPSR